MALDLSHHVDKLQGLRGMVDLLPEQVLLWQWIENKARQHFHRASIQEIRTPIIEPTELFSRGIGEATDVVGKEMYTFCDRGERNCTLRPEGTASIVRATIEHNLLSKGPQRLWYSGPMFRYERPQAGRQRQFHQLGLEYLGFKDPRSDAETITVAWDLLIDLGLKNLNLEINSLGNLNDRIVYRNHLVKWLEERKDYLDQTSQARLYTNPLRILDSKDPKTQEILKETPVLIDLICPESRERLERVKAELSNAGVPFTVNPKLVRGLDYYCHTAFEITSHQLGAQSTICGGGRYDGLIEELGGKPTPAIGWALGMERLMLLLSNSQPNCELSQKDIFIVSRGEKAESLAMAISRKLRKANFIVENDLSGSAFAKQLKRADRSNAHWIILIGDDEATKGEVIIKTNKREGEAQTDKQNIKIDNLLNRLKILSNTNH